MAQNSKINDLMKKTPAYNYDISKKLNEIYSVTSAHYKSDKSAEHKSAATKPAYRSSSGSRPAQNPDVEMTVVSSTQKTYLDKQLAQIKRRWMKKARKRKKSFVN